MDKEKSLSIIKVFKDFPLAEYAELAIDTSLDNEVLSSVPVISTAHGIYKTFKSFKK